MRKQKSGFEPEELLQKATRARRRAYAPYSGYRVGAAVVTASGNVYTGANIENASFGLTVCAERVAIWQAVVAGERRLVALAVVTSNGGSPCGACRQVFAEFAPADAVVWISDPRGRNRRSLTLEQLLPDRFQPDHLSFS